MKTENGPSTRRSRLMGKNGSRTNAWKKYGIQLLARTSQPTMAPMAKTTGYKRGHKKSATVGLSSA